MEAQYLEDAEAAGIDVTSSFEGREGTSIDAFHFRHLQLAVEAQPLTPDQEQTSHSQEPCASNAPPKPKRQKIFQHPYGSGDTWR